MKSFLDSKGMRVKVNKSINVVRSLIKFISANPFSLSCNIFSIPPPVLEAWNMDSIAFSS